jgi:hypothetical protein
VKAWLQTWYVGEDGQLHVRSNGDLAIASNVWLGQRDEARRLAARAPSMARVLVMLELVENGCPMCEATLVDGVPHKSHCLLDAELTAAGLDTPREEGRGPQGDRLAARARDGSVRLNGRAALTHQEITP